MKLCEYGCGQEAKYQFKNGKWCCSKTLLSCPEIRKSQQGEKHPRIGKKSSTESKKKMSESHIGKPGYWNGKKRSAETCKKISKKLKGKPLLLLTKTKMKTSIENIYNRYPFFSKIEQMRYDPNKPEEKEIQVHCKNSKCQNSKESGGWFTPTYNQLYERIRQLENPDGNDGSYLYCCDECKNECSLYNLRDYKIEKISENQFYTYSEYQTFREYVLKRDNYICQYCGKLAVHIHHERPQKIEPFFSLDPDLAWSTCEKCHYKYGHRDECSTGNLASKQCKRD